MERVNVLSGTLRPNAGGGAGLASTSRRDRLRAATNDHHVVTETFVDGNGFFATENGLRAFLRAQARINAGIDANFSTAAARLLPDWDLRRKLVHLQADLAQWGEMMPEPLPAVEFDYIDNDASLFGALYVLEGSTLGGMVLAKRLKDNNILCGGRICRFLSVYGRETATMWHSFIARLDNAVMNAEDEKKMHAAAERTFSLVRDTLAAQIIPTH